MIDMPKGTPSLDEILIQSHDIAWREKSLKGIHEKMLWRNEETGASIALIKFDKGAGIPQPVRLSGPTKPRSPAPWRPGLSFLVSVSLRG